MFKSATTKCKEKDFPEVFEHNINISLNTNDNTKYQILWLNKIYFMTILI